ncbi:hydantoinase/oxoprolinase N-terminal domain-containing protein [Thermaerobacter litoralis]
MRIGIDVGGTNTDAVLLDGSRVVAWHKAPTSPDVTAGIAAAVRGVLQAAGCRPGAVQAVMIGTTHFANAVVERRLEPVGVIRIGLPATAALPPLVDWPRDLAACVGDQVFLVRGGHEFDGRPIAPLDEPALRAAARRLKAEGLKAAAVTAVFSPVDPSAEERARAILEEEYPGLRVTLSHAIGRVGLLERENATVLNASLTALAGRLVEGFREALRELGLHCPFYFTQNDGTLLSADALQRYPVRTVSSGPTNSMRGAAFLSGLRDAVVIDIGGTTTDVGVLVRGFPRPAAATVTIGGVRTNFPMPDVLSVGLGGGSYVEPEPLRIGPRSAGFRIRAEARVFGGERLTATDLVVAAGRAEVGDPARVRDLPPQLVADGLERMARMIADAVDRVKTSAEPVPVIAVGGGSILMPDHLPGAARVVRPDHYAVANAVGAAMAQVAGEVERVVSLEGIRREQALAAIRGEAVERARAAGARPETIEVVDQDEVSLAYLPGNAVRFRVKAVGDLTLAPARPA